jgi:predicted metalloprotease
LKTKHVAGLAAALLLLTGCTKTIAGTATAEEWNPNRVADLPVTSGPSGERPGVRPAQVTVRGSDNGPIDRLAADAVDDIQAYWQRVLPNYRPVTGLNSYDSTKAGMALCGADTQGLVNAFYCGNDDTVSWDRAVLLPTLERDFGDMSVVAVLAHELGHAVQTRLGAAGASSIVREQQADCYAGSYFRYVADGDSPRFQISTGPGLNQILSTLFFIRDTPGTSAQSPEAHGTAFDRVTAFQLGFGDDFARCGQIDAAEVNRRVTPSEEGPASPDLRVSDPVALGDLQDTINGVFGTPEPQLTADKMCTGSHSVGYCPDDDTVAVNLSDLSTLPDFSAFAEIVSRYALSVQHARGLPLNGLVAAQRTACLTGLWAGTIVPSHRQALELSPGDLDEAVAELLAGDSLIAADDAGAALPSGFARVEAFRAGYTASTGSAGVAACLTE